MAKGIDEATLDGSCQYLPTPIYIYREINRSKQKASDWMSDFLSTMAEALIPQLCKVPQKDYVIYIYCLFYHVELDVSICQLPTAVFLHFTSLLMCLLLPCLQPVVLLPRSHPMLQLGLRSSRGSLHLPCARPSS